MTLTTSVLTVITLYVVIYWLTFTVQAPEIVKVFV